MSTRTKTTSPAGPRATHLAFRRIFLALVPLLITGCYTLHVAQCTLPDTPTNRVAATNIVASVAIQHGFVLRADQMDQISILASYDFPGESRKRPLNLNVYADAGLVTTSLTQTRKSKKPTERFLSVAQDLINGFKQKFGSGVEVNIYRDEMPQ